MKVSDLIAQLKDIPDDVEVTVRLDIASYAHLTPDASRVEGKDLIEVMKVRKHHNGPITHASIFVLCNDAW